MMISHYLMPLLPMLLNPSDFKMTTIPEFFFIANPFSHIFTKTLRVQGTDPTLGLSIHTDELNHRVFISAIKRQSAASKLKPPSTRFVVPTLSIWMAHLSSLKPMPSNCSPMPSPLMQATLLLLLLQKSVSSLLNFVKPSWITTLFS
jgi:hypothetical protein